MRRGLSLSPLLLVACAANPPPSDSTDTPVHGVTPGHKCDRTGTDRFIGQPATSDTGAAILRESHAAVLRWAPPGVMLTMDYREDRVTVRLDPSRKITAINCG